jgi:hypothetical protein
MFTRFMEEVGLSADLYLQTILDREGVDTSIASPVRNVQASIEPTIRIWADVFFRRISPSGSFAKGTANKSGTDIDLFISLSDQTPHTLKEIYESLFDFLQRQGYTPKRQNVSINVRVNGQDVDLVPGRLQDHTTGDHSLYRRRADTWTKTNIEKHIASVRASGCANEIRLVKLWRNQRQLDFPSFYLELVTIAALRGSSGPLSNRVLETLRYIRDELPAAAIIDPANTNNRVSDDLTIAEKQRLSNVAKVTLGAKTWQEIVR